MIEDIANVNGVDIAYRLRGDESHPLLVLIHGLSTPMTGWPEYFVEELIAKGFRILQLDNRDIGRSQSFATEGIPNIAWQVFRRKIGLRAKSCYSLDDMADDVLALQSHLGLPKFHVVGASMGGMIAQIVAIKAPEQCLSLTSIMSTTGNPKLPTLSKRVAKFFMSKPPGTSDEDKLNYQITKWKVVGSPQYPTPDEQLKSYVQSQLERGITFGGTTRQLASIIAADDRTERLKQLKVPTLVLHGECDELVDVAGGRATAEAVPGAKFIGYPGMAHDLPQALAKDLTEQIAIHAKQVN